MRPWLRGRGGSVRVCVVRGGSAGVEQGGRRWVVSYVGAAKQRLGRISAQRTLKRASVAAETVWGVASEVR